VADGEVRTVAIGTEDGGASARDRAVAVEAGTAYVDVAGRSTAFTTAAAPEVDRTAAGTGRGADRPATLEAPMPGQVLAVHAASGSAVAENDPILTLEAMKMEHVVVAPSAGRVEEVSVRAGDQVQRGQPLAQIAPLAPAPPVAREAPEAATALDEGGER
jgi:biotin carboxyl carrier protein